MGLEKRTKDFENKIFRLTLCVINNLPRLKYKLMQSLKNLNNGKGYVIELKFKIYN